MQRFSAFQMNPMVHFRPMRLAYFLAIAVLIETGSLALAEDWPMLGHDVRRTGSTREEIRGPTSRKWYRSFHELGLFTRHSG